VLLAADFPDITPAMAWPLAVLMLLLWLGLKTWTVRMRLAVREEGDPELPVPAWQLRLARWPATYPALLLAGAAVAFWLSRVTPA